MISAGVSRQRRECFFRCAMLLLLVSCFVSHSPFSMAQTAQKVVEGKVLGSNDQPLVEAIVYLKNGKTGDIKSFISIAGGSYRFGQLSPDVDYEIWSEYQGKKSPTKTISSFDSRKQLNYVLKVDTGK